MNILLGVTGSVASVLTPKLVNLLEENNSVKIIATKSSLYFWNPLELKTEIFKDEDELNHTKKYIKGDKILHIELRKWADLLLIAPLTANTLAKLANGLADNLLTNTVRAWDSKPLIIAPSMNTYMFHSPVTTEHLDKLREWFNLAIAKPISKELACGDSGVGAMADINTIVEIVNREAHQWKIWKTV